MHRTDWTLWAAACDAGAAVAVGGRIGHHYYTLVAPFATVIPALASAKPGIRDVTASAADHHQPTSGSSGAPSL